jgi:hypothetical protein
MNIKQHAVIINYGNIFAIHFLKEQPKNIKFMTHENILLCGIIDIVVYFGKFESAPFFGMSCWVKQTIY